MSGAVRTSTCVDCSTPLIGERLRCPACHARHASSLAASGVPVDDGKPRVGLFMRAVRWFVVLEAIGIVGLGFLLAVKGCP